MYNHKVIEREHFRQEQRHCGRGSRSSAAIRSLRAYTRKTRGRFPTVAELYQGSISTDLIEPRVPDWRANAFATYRFGERWSLTAGGRYSGTQYNTLDNSDTNPYAFTGTSPFIVFDLRARYANERWNAAFGVDNAGDEEYWAFHPYTRRSMIAEFGVGF